MTIVEKRTVVILAGSGWINCSLSLSEMDQIIVKHLKFLGDRSINSKKSDPYGLLSKIAGTSS